MNKRKIAQYIESKLGYTNGWIISDEDYKKHCLKISDQIIKENRIEILKQKISDLREFENYYFSAEFDSLTFSQTIKLKIKQFKDEIKSLK